MKSVNEQAVQPQVKQHFSWFQFFGSFFTLSILAALLGVGRCRLLRIHRLAEIPRF